MTKLLPPLSATHKRKVETWASPAYPGWTVEYIYTPGAVCKPIPDIGPEPANVQVIAIYFREWLMDFDILKMGGFDLDEFIEEMEQRILSGIPQ